MLMTDDSPRGTILLVDDNMHIRRLAKVHLERAGYTVITAADGEEGLHVYERHRSCVVLLLTDVAMPKINGLELADRVQGMDSNLPVVLMSGDAPYEYRDLEWLAKPFAPTELIEMVRRAMSASAQPQRAVADSAA
jgi:two-component system cell cycle sensor histidine kinase/response regulator CckA